jgi:hypothetical protein
VSETASEAAPAKKAPAKKAGTKKAAAKKAPSKKAAAKTAPAKKRPPVEDEQHEQHRDEQQSGRNGGSSPDGRPKASRVAVLAASQLLELTGKEPEGVIGLDRTDDGWRVHVEVLELRRIPATTDVLATYEVTVDTDGDLVGYRRLHLYGRGAPGED